MPDLKWCKEERTPAGEGSSFPGKTGLPLRQTPCGAPNSDHANVHRGLGSGCNDRLSRFIDVDQGECSGCHFPDPNEIWSCSLRVPVQGGMCLFFIRK